MLTGWHRVGAAVAVMGAGVLGGAPGWADEPSAMTAGVAASAGVASGAGLASGRALRLDLRAGVAVSPSVSLDARLGFGRRVQREGPGQTTTELGLGVSWRPRWGDGARGLLELGAGLSLAGDTRRLGVNAALGVLWSAGSGVWAGPALRYVHRVEPDVLDGGASQQPEDARAVTLGLVLHFDGLGETAPQRARLPTVAAPEAGGGDRDDDGVADREDLCPALAAGATADARRAGCPASDVDGDGFWDADDRCPMVAGRDAGCPLRDYDGDGVGDAVDQCVTVAGLAAHQGCAPPVRATVSAALATVRFLRGHDRIVGRVSFSALDAAAAQLRAEGGRAVLVGGRVAGEPPGLAASRALRVRAYLTEVGVGAARVEVAPRIADEAVVEVTVSR